MELEKGAVPGQGKSTHTDSDRGEKNLAGICSEPV